jgi:long-chain acyl-CoA synthetase
MLRHIKRMVPTYHIPGAIEFVQVMKEGGGLPFTPVHQEPEDIALLQYTGGTTGVSKGAILSHQNIIANMLQVKALLGGSIQDGYETVIAPLPLYHIYSFTINCMMMTAFGNHTVLITNPRDIPAFVRELRRWRFTLFSGLNSLFVALCANPGFRALDFSALRITISGGMALTTAVAHEWEAVTGCPIIEGYGLTETSPVISVNPPGAIRLGTIGPPLKGTEISIRDSDGQSVPVGGVGELCVKGPQVMTAYWQQPEETALVFNEEGWLRTGDLAQVDEAGYLKIVDRKKDMIIVSGFNVYPNELEEVISSHPDIAECVVVGLPDEKSGELIKLYAVSRNPHLSIEAVRDYCRQRLTAYKVPQQVEFRDELPKTNVGKVLRRVLKEEELHRRNNHGNGHEQHG